MSRVQKLNKERIKFQNLAEQTILLNTDFKTKTVAERDRVLAKERDLFRKEKELSQKEQLLANETKRIYQLNADLLNQMEQFSITEKESLSNLDKVKQDLGKEEIRIMALNDSEKEDISRLEEVKKLLEIEINDLFKKIDLSHELYRDEVSTVTTNKKLLEANFELLESKHIDLLADIKSTTATLIQLKEEVEKERVAYSLVKGSSSDLTESLIAREEQLVIDEQTIRIHKARISALYKKLFNKEITI